jgi:hypothetical protein
LNGFSKFFDLSPQNGFIVFVDQIPSQTPPPLPNCGLMIGHLCLLKRKG